MLWQMCPPLQMKTTLLPSLQVPQVQVGDSDDDGVESLK
jgi:hypothetical protein